MKTIVELMEDLKNGNLQEIKQETRLELVNDLMAAVKLSKNEIAPIYAKFMSLMSSNSAFANKVYGIYNVVFSSIDATVRDEYLSKVAPVRSDYIDNPDKENRKRLVRALYAVLAIATDSDVVKIVTAERELWSTLVEYSNK